MDFKTFKESQVAIHGEPTMRFLMREGKEKFYVNCYSWEQARFIAKVYNAVIIEKV